MLTVLVLASARHRIVDGGEKVQEQDLHDWERAPEADKTGALSTGLKLNAHGSPSVRIN